MSIPVVVKVLGTLAAILVINRLCKQLIFAVATGALVLAVWSGHSAGRIASIAWGRLVSPDHLLLLAVVLEVIWLSRQMAESGVMKDLVEAIRARLSRRGSMAVLPAVIGFLPMPGGALFSAPLVDGCDDDGTLDPPLKAQINHWFRHIWEYWWPLYPGVLLATQITGLEIWQFMILGIPLTLASVGAGWLFLLRKLEPEEDGARRGTGERTEGITSLVLPIVVVVLVYAAVKGAHAGMTHAGWIAFDLQKYIPMIIGIGCAMAILQVRRPLDGKQWNGILVSWKAFSMVIIVAAARVYGAFIEADLPGGVSMVAQMRAELAAAGIPVVAMMMLIPFISGLTMGIAVGFVGASFPIVVSLVGRDVPAGQLMAATALAYGFGYVGMMLSPVHVCLMVTSEYFKTEVLKNALALAKPGLVIMTCAVVVYLLYGAVL